MYTEFMIVQYSCKQKCQGKQNQQTVFYLGPCTRSRCSEGEVFVLSADGGNLIEEGSPQIKYDSKTILCQHALSHVHSYTNVDSI